MKLEHKQLEEIIFGKMGFRRFTQDSSILPDVWMEFGEKPNDRVDLLLTPTWGTAPGTLAMYIDDRLKVEKKDFSDRRTSPVTKEKIDGIAYNASIVAVNVDFAELIRAILPLTVWWKNYMLEENGEVLNSITSDEKFREKLGQALLSDPQRPWDLNLALSHKVWQNKPPKLHPHLIWLMKIVGAISLVGIIDESAHEDKKGVDAIVKAFAEFMTGDVPIDENALKSILNAEKNKTELLNDVASIINAFAELMRDIIPIKEESLGTIWAVNINRPATAMIWRSSSAVKADASRRLFEVKCDDIRWAVIDSGIDATHLAFRLKDPATGLPYSDPFLNGKNNTRIIKTYDFTPIRKILSRDRSALDGLSDEIKERFAANPAKKQELQKRLKDGRAVDWAVLAPLLEVTNDNYKRPLFEHGTHVAGIIAADWRRDGPENRKKEPNIQGVCPDLRLYDLRVLDEKGESDEFSILAALQFAQYINTNTEYLAIHGVNLSLSIRHKVKNFACGCTPVCEEAERLVNSGLVVVAAAGNDGYLESRVDGQMSEGYRSISITDPGNAEGVITVGATHRDSPHTYGVSYFSSRGPTGDGRIKPDLVAPGEKITSTVPENGLKTMDGTSMAAPHVSGAAALLIGRHRELIGKPVRIKEILCETATDLGRERYFQGHGMLDILRAMQSV